MAVEFGFPYFIDARGRTGGDERVHLRELIEQLLFTSPGERVNRSELGTGLAELTFAAASDELAGAIEFRVEAALQQWLGERLTIKAVAVRAEGAVLHIEIRYTPRGSEDEHTLQVSREVG